MDDFYIIAQNDADTAFDVVRSDDAKLTDAEEIVALVQSRTSFPLGGRIRSKWTAGELSGRVVPDCTEQGKRARTALLYSRIDNEETLSSSYFERVGRKLKELLGSEISDALVDEFVRNLKSTVRSGRGRLKNAIVIFVIVLLVALASQLIK